MEDDAQRWARDGLSSFTDERNDMDEVRSSTGQTVALLGAPMLLLAAHLVQPAHGTSTAEEVATQAAHQGAFNASTVLGLLAVLLAVPAVLALGRLVADRRGGRIGTAMAAGGATALGFLLGTGVGATTIAAHGGAAAVRLTDELESNPAMGVGVGVMLLGWTLGLLTLAVVLGRSQRLPWWAAAALGVGVLVPAFAGGKVPVAVGFGLLLAAFATAAVRLRQASSAGSSPTIVSDVTARVIAT